MIVGDTLDIYIRLYKVKSRFPRRDQKTIVKIALTLYKVKH